MAQAKTQEPEQTPTGLVDKVVEAYIKTRDEIAERTKAFEDAVAELKAMQEKRADWLKGQMDKLGVESFKTTHGTAFIDWKDSATVADALAFMSWVGADFEAHKHFLENRVSKTAIKQSLDEGQTLPPGVNYTKIKDVKVRRK